MKDLIIDGELQLDAAIDPSVAKIKAPNSKVAGNANTWANAASFSDKALPTGVDFVITAPLPEPSVRGQQGGRDFASPRAAQDIRHPRRHRHHPHIPPAQKQPSGGVCR